jgi:hypothetical protein
MKTRPQITARRNLARRPRAPAKGTGRVQVLARRALWVLGTASTSQIMEWTYVTLRLEHDADAA